MFLDSTAKRKRRRQPRHYSFDARLKGRSKSKKTVPVWHRIGVLLFSMVVLGFLGLFLFAGFVRVRDAIFANNDRFAIKKIDVIEGQIKTEAMIREYLAYEGINIGTNLFAFDIGAFEKVYLKRNPLVRMIQVSRDLPDRLEVAIQERDPLARIGQRTTLVADSEGFVFRLNSKQRLHRLPVIIGCKDPQLVPGEYVRGSTRRAVDVLYVCDNPRVGVRVVGIDISRRDYLIVHVQTPYGIKECLLSWDDMDKGLAYSGKDLLVRLNRLKEGIKRDRGRHNRYDVTFPGSVRAR
jgi:cell division septal protein FtsQ